VEVYEVYIRAQLSSLSSQGSSAGYLCDNVYRNTGLMFSRGVFFFFGGGAVAP
jgi:hypothetical protein